MWLSVHLWDLDADLGNFLGVPALLIWVYLLALHVWDLRQLHEVIQ